MRVALLGAPGSGKGTQSETLKVSLGIPHISSGDLLRQAVREGNELGQKAASYMSSGELVPDDLVLEMIRDRISRDDCREGFLFDGFPRTLDQATMLDSALAEMGKSLDHVVALDVPEELVVERLSGRRNCGQCGRLYHVRFQPPVVEGKCDDCGVDLSIRDDDIESTVRGRLRVYNRQTSPLIGFYGKAGLLRTVKGTGASAEIGQRILELVGVDEAGGAA